MESSKYIGFTSTIPVEIIYAAGFFPIDLNNLFITSSSSNSLIEEAEQQGIPRNYCAWIKGLYSIIQKTDNLWAVVGVTQGDCSETIALIDNLRDTGLKIIPFGYPFDSDRKQLQINIEKLGSTLNTNWESIAKTRIELDKIRSLGHEIDRMTWEDNVVTGYENHSYLINLSDFKQDPQSYAKELSQFAKKASRRTKYDQAVRLGFVGVPPIFPDLYDFIETINARVVYNEVQHQFSMPFSVTSVVDQYQKYTYPYGMKKRISFIKKEIERRRIHGIIHYVQSFCYHQMEEGLLRKHIDIPILRIEGDRPVPIDSRTRLRLESFVETLEPSANKLIS